MSTQKIFLIIGGFIATGIAIFLYRESLQKTNTSTMVGVPAVTIVRTKDGYEPKEATIKKGDTVLFTNESGEYHWPASDLHPTHAIYSEFDPLRPVADGEEWSFTFEKAGVWKYHDHIRANKVGIVSVIE